MDEGASYALTEWDVEPGAKGPPVHIHHEHDEGFYVMSGRFGFMLDGVTTYGKPGAHVLVPRGTRNAAGTRALGTARSWSSCPRPAWSNTSATSPPVSAKPRRKKARSTCEKSSATSTTSRWSENQSPLPRQRERSVSPNLIAALRAGLGRGPRKKLGETPHRLGQLGQIRNHRIGERWIVLLSLTVDPHPGDAELAGRLDVVEIALGDVDPHVGGRPKRGLKQQKVRRVRLVGRHVFGRDDRVERHGEPPLSQRDDVAVAAGQECQLPAFLAKLAESWSDVAEGWPVGNGRHQGRRVVRLEGERELPGNTSRRLGQYRAVALERPVGLDLRLVGAVRVEERRTVPREKQLPGGRDAMAPIVQGAEAIKRQPARGHRLSYWPGAR